MASSGFEIDADGVLRRGGAPIVVPGIRFVAAIGAGANGCVFRARDILLEREVAVKIWTEKVGSSNSRSLHEARKLAIINHHSFVPVFSYDVRDGMAVAVMRLVEGQSLTAWLASSEDILARISIWTQLSAALRFLYAQGVMHGDPHTGNIMISQDPEELLDSRLRGSSVAGRTRHKVSILDTGTSKFWDDRADFERREKAVLIETIDRLFGACVLVRTVYLDESISLQDILRLGDGLALVLAAACAGPPRGLDNMEDFLREMDHARQSCPDHVFSAVDVTCLARGLQRRGERRLSFSRRRTAR